MLSSVPSAEKRGLVKLQKIERKIRKKVLSDVDIRTLLTHRLFKGIRFKRNLYSQKVRTN